MSAAAAASPVASTRWAAPAASNGFTAADDSLPPRMTEEPMPSGPSKGSVSHVKEMMPKYYAVRGWDEAGRPTEAKLAELELA